jgi:hypothetical protein
VDDERKSDRRGDRHLTGNRVLNKESCSVQDSRPQSEAIMSDVRMR